MNASRSCRSLVKWRVFPAIMAMSAFSIASLSGSSVAHADDLSELEGLLDRPIVSSASHTNEDASTAPATSSTLTAEDIRRYGIRSLDEAINYLSLGMMAATPLRSGEVGARGVLITGDFNNHVLLLIDGHAVNELWYGSVPLDRAAGIPMELIDHVEVVLGPGSVLYGSYAMLGVINVVTKRAKDFHGVHVIAETEVGKERDGHKGGLVGLAGAEATSARVALGAGYEFKLFGRPAEVTGQVEYYDQKGPAFRFGPQTGVVDTLTGAPHNYGPKTAPGTWGGVAANSYETMNPSAYARLKVADFELIVRGSMNERRTPFINYSDSYTTDFDEPVTRTREIYLSADARYTTRLSSAATLLTRLYGDNYNYSSRKRTSASGDCKGLVSGCDLESIGIARWVGLETRATIEWWKDGSFTTIVGLDGRVRSVQTRYDTFDRPTGHLTASDSPHPRQDDLTLGAYLQQNARPTTWVAASAGVRADIDERYGKTASPRAAVAFTPWRDGTLKAIYASAFRIPSTYEATYTETSTPPPKLAPESVRSVEGSIEQRFGTQRLLFGVFHSWWSELIIYRYDANVGIGTYENTGTIQNTGFNAGYEGSFVAQRLRLALNVTGAYSRQKDPGATTSTALPAAPSYFGNARVSYDPQGKLPTLALATQLTGAALADQYLDGGFRPTPTAPTRLSARATVTGPMPWLKHLSYRASITGVTASKYPYVAGPYQVASPQQPSAELVPVDQFRIGLGLQYDLDP